MMATDKRPLFEQVAERLVEQLEQGTSPFQKPWSDEVDDFLPLNPTTGKHYQGMNTIWLLMQGHEDPRWLTFKQAAAKGWSVERGAKGTLINYVKTHDSVKAVDHNGKPVIGTDGKQKTIKVLRGNPIITSAFVFNAEKVKGIEPLTKKPPAEQTWNNIERVERIVRNSGVSVAHGGNSAFYNIVFDSITMPRKEQFDQPAKYYSVLMHELGHWTGHTSRLNRPTLYSLEREDVAKEELRAEIASLMLGNDLNIGRDQSQHASYVNSWISALKNDPSELYRASADAQKIREYILKLEITRNMKEAPAETLQLHDRVDYRGASYKVVEVLPEHRLLITDLSTGRSLRLSEHDRLYASLVEAKSQAARNLTVTDTGRHVQERVSHHGAAEGNTESINSNFKR